MYPLAEGKIVGFILYYVKVQKASSRIRNRVTVSISNSNKKSGEMVDFGKSDKMIKLTDAGFQFEFWFAFLSPFCF